MAVSNSRSSQPICERTVYGCSDQTLAPTWNHNSALEKFERRQNLADLSHSVGKFFVSTAGSVPPLVYFVEFVEWFGDILQRHAAF